MTHPLRCVFPVLMATLGGARGVQAQSVDVGTHVGVREDGRRFLGAQLAVAVAPEIRLNGGVLSVRDVGADASLAEVELSVRWATTITRSVRPYLISGLVLERSRVSNVKSTDLGWVAGAGLGFGRGAVEPFLEMRALKAGAVTSLFSVGLRVSTTPFRHRGVSTPGPRPPRPT